MLDEIILQAYPDLLFSYQARSLLVTDQRGMMIDGFHGLYEHDLMIGNSPIMGGPLPIWMLPGNSRRILPTSWK